MGVRRDIVVILHGTTNYWNNGVTWKREWTSNWTQGVRWVYRVIGVIELLTKSP